MSARIPSFFVAVLMTAASLVVFTPPQAIARSNAPAVGTCAPNTGPFRPTRIDIDGVGTDIGVLGLRRARGQAPATAPVNEFGKHVMAWSSSDPAPGARWGNVLLNAHTWPDGSALGNRMLGNLRVGAMISIRNGSRTLCYKVTRRIEVPPTGRAIRGYYARRTPSKLAMVVCSGTRLGPGVWTKRTIWYAQPLSR